MGVSETSDRIQIQIKMPNPSQEHPVSSKALNQDLNDMDFLCTFKMKIESQTSDHWSSKDQWTYPNWDQDAKPQSGTSSVLQSPKWVLRGYWCPLHLHNQDREQKFGKWIYQTSDHVQIKIKVPNTSQEPPESSKAPNEDLKNMDFLCTFKIKIGNQNLNHLCI